MTSAASFPNRRWILLFQYGLALSALIVMTGCSIGKDLMDTPPESEYTQAEVYAPMEAAIAEAAEMLPDFAGFASRRWSESPCSHNGLDDPDYTNVEISYALPSDFQESELVRTQYVDVLREHWTALGYEIRTDQSDELEDGRVDHDLTATREDGIDLWYQVWWKVNLIVSSGCVPVSDNADIEYIAPAGGIEPGGRGDLVAEEYFPDGIPTDQAAAIDPFAGTPAATGPVPFDSPDSYDGLILDAMRCVLTE